MRNEAPSRGWRARSSRRRVGWTLLLVLFTFVATTGLSSGVAKAADANCVSSTMQGQDRGSKILPNRTVGVWYMYVSISAADRCDHGDLRVGVTYRDDALRTYGNSISTSSVQYMLSNENRWRTLDSHYNSSATKDGNSVVYYPSYSHLDMAKGVRITVVRINSAVGYSGDGGSSATGATYTCNLINRNCWD